MSRKKKSSHSKKTATANSSGPSVIWLGILGFILGSVALFVLSPDEDEVGFEDDLKPHTDESSYINLDIPQESESVPDLDTEEQFQQKVNGHDQAEENIRDVNLDQKENTQKEKNHKGEKQKGNSKLKADTKKTSQKQAKDDTKVWSEHPKTWEAISGFNVVGTVERKEWSSYKHKADEKGVTIATAIARERVPVLLSDSPASKKWKANKRWNEEYIKKKIPEMAMAKISNSRSDYLYYFPEQATPQMYLEHQKAWQENVAIDSETFFEYCADSDNPPYTYYFHVLQKEAPLDGWEAVVRDIIPRMFMRVEEIDKKDYGVFSDMDARSITNVWLGGDGITTHLHNDYANNYYYQIRGYKRFLLVPPSNHSQVYQFPFIHPATRQSQRNFSVPEAQTFDAEPLDVISVVLGPGDMFYLPPYWFHHVIAIELAMSINVWSPSVERSVMEKMFDLRKPAVLTSSDQMKSLTGAAVFLRYVFATIFGRQAAQQLIQDELVNSRFSPLFQNFQCSDSHFSPGKCWPEVMLSNNDLNEIKTVAFEGYDIVSKLHDLPKFKKAPKNTREKHAIGALEILMVDWLEDSFTDAPNICWVYRCLTQDKYWETIDVD